MVFGDAVSCFHQRNGAEDGVMKSISGSVLFSSGVSAHCSEEYYKLKSMLHTCTFMSTPCYCALYFRICKDLCILKHKPLCSIKQTNKKLSNRQIAMCLYCTTERVSQIFAAKN